MMAGIPDALNAMPTCAYCGTLKPYHDADCPNRTSEMARHSDTRNRVIEECARVAESYRNVQIPAEYSMANRIAAAIRALKDKP